MILLPPSQGTVNNGFGCHSLGKARDAAKQFTQDSLTHPPHLKIIWLKMSIVQKLRNPDLFQGILELALYK